METTLAQTKTTTPLKSSPIPASTKQASPLVSVKRTTTSSQKKKRKKQEKDPIVTNEDKENDEVVIVVQDSQPLTSCASNSDNNVPMEENPIDTPKMMVIKATQEDEVKVRSKRGKRNSAGRPLRPRKSETDLLSGQYPPSPQTRREASIDLVDVTGKIPSARWAHSMNFIPSKHQLILYGGDDNSEKTIGDLFLYDIVEKRWSSPLNCSSVSRSWHGATYIESKQLLLVFGGERLTCSETSQENEIFSEIMVLDTEVLLWYPPAISGHAPTPRSGHTCSNVHDDIVVFGGTGKRKWLNTVDVLDTGKSSRHVRHNRSRLNIQFVDHWDWKSVKKVGEPPAPRAYHSATVLGNKLVIFGGRDPKKSFNTVHVLERIDAGTFRGLNLNLLLLIITGHTFIVVNVGTWSWFHPCVVGSGPSPRSGHSATAIDASNVLIYGGWDSPAFSKLGYNRSLHFSDAFLLNIGEFPQN